MRRPGTAWWTSARFVPATLTRPPTGATTFVARRDPKVREEPLMDLASGYVLRSIDAVPRQGDKAPWRLRQDYVRDVLSLRRGAIVDKDMQFS